MSMVKHSEIMWTEETGDSSTRALSSNPTSDPSSSKQEELGEGNDGFCL
jgi:hypothetical protein